MNPDWRDPDDAPDLSAPEWAARLQRQPVKRGRPVAETTKISTTIRLDQDIIAHFKAGGPNWQSRINQALRNIISGQ